VEPSALADYRPAYIDANDAIKLAAMWMKRQYDQKHKPMFFKPGEYAALQLHRGYIPGLKGRNVKIEQQFTGLYEILERVGKLAYRIELPPTLRIHPVVSVVHLEPAPRPAADPYRRPFSQTVLEEPKPEKLLRKRIAKHGYGSESAEYLVRFTGRSAEDDQWIRGTRLPMEPDYGVRKGGTQLSIT
jgi:hypothetical protein